jgi:hypothetical protein
MHRELAIAVLDVAGDRVHRDAEPVADFRIAVAAREQAQDVGLAGGQRGHSVLSRAAPRCGRRRGAPAPHLIQNDAGDARAHGRAAGTQFENARDEVRVAAVLQDVAGGAGLDARNHVALVAEHRDHHDVALGQVARREAYDLGAVYVRQAQVDEQHIGRDKQQARERVAPRAHLLHDLRARIPDERRGEALEHDGIILDDHHAHCGARLFAHWPR